MRTSHVSSDEKVIVVTHAHVFPPCAGMFVSVPSTNEVWFNKASPRDADRDFELIGQFLCQLIFRVNGQVVCGTVVCFAGTLVGLAIYNRQVICI